MGKSKDDYPVGYGKPPAAHQFKKGQSGNPSGKKNGKSLAQYIAEVGDEEKDFLQDGKKVTKTLKHAAAERLYIDAAKGKHAATKIAMEAERGAMGDILSAGSVLAGTDEFEVARTHMDWLKLIEEAEGEQNDAIGSD